MSDDAWRRRIAALRRPPPSRERDERIAEALRRWGGPLEPDQRDGGSET